MGTMGDTNERAKCQAVKVQRLIDTVPPCSFHTNTNYFRVTVKQKNSEGGSAKCETNKIN